MQIISKNVHQSIFDILCNILYSLIDSRQAKFATEILT